MDQEVLYHRRLVIGVTTFIEILGLTSYVLRLLARRLSGTRLWYDDYVMGVGWVSQTQAKSFPGSVAEGPCPDVCLNDGNMLLYR